MQPSFEIDYHRYGVYVDGKGVSDAEDSSPSEQIDVDYYISTSA